MSPPPFSPSVYLDAVSAKIREVAALPLRRVLVLGATKADATERHAFTEGRCAVTHVARPADLDEFGLGEDGFDLILIATHNNADEELRLARLRKRYPEALLAAWTLDNHHDFLQNLRVVIGADLIFPGHWPHHRYLATVRSIVGPHLPLSPAQFTSQTIERFYPEGFLATAERRDALHGGFHAYPTVERRNQFILALREAIRPSALQLISPSVDYFAQPMETRLRDWCSHKVGLVVPVNRDLSSRVFECLLTGQIPLVAMDVPDLDTVIPLHVQEQLPIVRFPDWSVDAVRAGHQLAVSVFNAAGAEGVRRRFEWVKAHHEIPARVARVSAFVERFTEIQMSESERGLRPYAVERSG